MDLMNLQKAKIPDFSLYKKGVMVCASGGVDSTVLFRVMINLKKFKKIPDLQICHVNFHLRGKESNDDEQFLRSMASAASIPFYSPAIKASQSRPTTGESTQEWARRVRYEFFRESANQGWAIALAHHQDDVAENVILRMSRGASLVALSGMQVWDEPYWRPFLGISKRDLQAWAVRHNLPHREDSSNATMDYSRNIIRHKVLPELELMFPGASERIARTGRDAHEVAGYARQKALADCTAESIPEVNGAKCEALSIPLKVFTHLPDSVAKDVICSLIDAGHKHTFGSRVVNNSRGSNSRGSNSRSQPRAGCTVPPARIVISKNEDDNLRLDLVKASAQNSLGFHTAQATQTVHHNTNRSSSRATTRTVDTRFLSLVLKEIRARGPKKTNSVGWKTMIPGGGMFMINDSSLQYEAVTAPRGPQTPLKNMLTVSCLLEGGASLAMEVDHMSGARCLCVRNSDYRQVSLDLRQGNWPKHRKLSDPAPFQASIHVGTCDVKVTRVKLEKQEPSPV